MITYFELVTFLEAWHLEPRNNDLLNRLNEIKVDLSGDRYHRFINHMHLLLDERLTNSFSKIIENMDTIREDYDSFSEYYNDFIKETNFLFEILQTTLINEEERYTLKSYVIDVNNKAMDDLKKYVNNSRILNLIESGYIVD